MKNVLVLLTLVSLITLSSCKKDLVDTSKNNIPDVTNLQKFITDIESGVSFVFFHASWCENCEKQRPAVEAASNNMELDFVRFLEVEFDDNEEVNKEYGVTGFPQILIFKDGVEQTRLIGKGHSQEKIASLLKTYM